jgi:predicted aspartyl protease
VRAASFALLLAGCAYSNDAILLDLEAREPVPALDAAIDDGGAAPPAGALREVTLPMVEGKVPAVRGRLNGVEMPFVLDTGTSVVVVTAEAARDARIYLPKRAPELIGGPGHVSTDRLCAFASLDLGPNRFGAGVATVPVNQRPGRWMDLGTESYAIVGCSVLSHFAVTFDFAKREVRFRPTGRPGTTSTLFTSIDVNGKPFMLMVDSGATAVFLEPWAARELDLISKEREERHETRASEAAGALHSRFTLESVAVHGRVFRDVDGAAVNTFAGREMAGFRPAGLLGLKGFGDLVWTLDYGTRTLRLEP